MKALVIDEPLSMRVTEAPEPVPGPGEALVRVGAAGICAGDLYIFRGKNPYVLYPCIAGHEVAGTIATLGGGVTEFAVGDRVVVEPFLGCGNCYPCRIGKSNCCANLRILGVHQPGGYADFVVAPASHLHWIPETLSLVRASFAEPLAIAVQACRRGQVQAGELVFVLGCGPIGLALIETVRALGAHPLATDTNPDRLAMAAQLGAETLPAGDDLTKRLVERTEGEGAPVVIEATGVASVMEATVEQVAAGGRIVLVGLVPRGVGVTFPGLDFTRKEMTILGSRASVGCFPEALRLLASDQIRYPDVATELSMWDAPAVFAQLAQNPGHLHKGVLLP